MNKLSQIGNLLKKSYKSYSHSLLQNLVDRGFTDLRPSYLEILIFLSNQKATLIKEIGEECDLKKQTMTSHLNELEKKGYIKRVVNHLDKRGLMVMLTDYGEKFRFSLQEAIKDLEDEFLNEVGQVEMEKILFSLENAYKKFFNKKK